MLIIHSNEQMKIIQFTPKNDCIRSMPFISILLLLGSHYAMRLYCLPVVTNLSLARPSLVRPIFSPLNQSDSYYTYRVLLSKRCELILNKVSRSNGEVITNLRVKYLYTPFLPLIQPDSYFIQIIPSLSKGCSVTKCFKTDFERSL